MGFFYFDESIQERGEFIIGAVIYSDIDLTPKVFTELKSLGFRPGIDEFKSSTFMQGNLKLSELRERLNAILCNSKIGVVVVPVKDRNRLGDEAIFGLTKIIESNKLASQAHIIYFDTDIKVSDSVEQLFKKRFPTSELNLNQDSIVVAGLQIADLAAHLLGRMLLADMGIINKTVRAGENTPFDPDELLEHDYVIWSSLRHSFFMAPSANDPDSISHYESLMFDMTEYALHISSTCSEDLRRVSLERFGNCFLGCIV